MAFEQQKRSTNQKKAIEKVFLKFNKPLSMSEILDAGRVYSPTLNRATVYRNLKILLEEGWLKKVQLNTTSVFYRRQDQDIHHHFFCRLCNKAFELLGGYAKPKKKLAPRGFIVEDHDFVINGVCPSCVKE